ncbi:MAG: hypothetical protein L6R40_005723 [Gallowayella cf. fulva]|nr:MAG: hypothetical protein L6R40_005723 [Xanthomendoza cf. fulva]
MYAIIVGILFYYESFKDSAREIETLLKSIRESAIEIISTDLDFDAAADLRSTTAGPRLTRDYDEAVKAETRQLDHLSLLANRFSKGYNNFQRLRHRGKYIIDKKNLTKQRAEVDKAFEKKKAAAINFETYAQAFYRKKQQKALQELHRTLERQSRLLEDLNTRLSSIEKAPRIVREVLPSAMKVATSNPPGSHWF